jgi:DNA (cytosine-5)-methyltransferase 1
MRVASLFSGIGGLEIGLHKAGHRTELLCEIMPAAKAVLSDRFPQTELTDDVSKLRDLPRAIDIITAGFPCQDLSQAGLTKGLDGARSGLVGEVFRLAERSRAPWLVIENVPFMLQLNGGDAMRRIVDTLEELKYRWAWRVVDTNGFGLPQRRERVFLIASRIADPADVLLADDNPFGRPTTAIGRLAHGFYWTEGRGGLGWAVDAIPTLKNGSAVGIPSPPAILMPDGSIIKPNIRDAERLQGFDEDWTMPAERVARASLRWTLLGNAVSVPVAAWVGGRLAEPGHYYSLRDGPFPAHGKLPKAARFDGKKRYSVDISADPVGARFPHLADFLRYAGEPLSARATAGFLSRTREAALRFAPGFIEAVELHLERMGGVAPPPPSKPRKASRVEVSQATDELFVMVEVAGTRRRRAVA